MTPSARTVRRLAGRLDVQTARERAEQHLRDMIHAYGELSSLTLQLVAIEDVCSGGGGWTFGSSRAKVSCTLYVAAYYTTNQDIDQVLDAILSAGDVNPSLVAFSHTTQPHALADAHRLFGVGQILTWDTPSGQTVGEVLPCERASDPPTYRCLREGDHRTVKAVRSSGGSIFKLELNPLTYYRVGR
jgi:hypothetical protein